MKKKCFQYNPRFGIADQLLQSGSEFAVQETQEMPFTRVDTMELQMATLKDILSHIHSLGDIYPPGYYDNLQKIQEEYLVST